MNVSLINNDAVSGIIKLEIEKKDYEVQVDKSLRQYRQKAKIPGFRPGMVPLGLIQKMYGKHLVAEEVNKLVSEHLFKYMQENEIRILGNPLPNETEQQIIDFDVEEDFEFYFDIALAPVIELKLNKRDKLTCYSVIVDEAMINQQIKTYRQHFGLYEQVEVIEAEDLVRGTVTELQDGNIKEGGIVVEKAVIMPKYIKGKREQNKFLGATLNETVVFNPQKAYKGVTAEIASFLKVDKEVAEHITADFQFEIKEITRFKEAELNKELFDKVFDENTTETEEAFREKVKSILADQYKQQSDYKLIIDIHKLLIRKAGDIKFADDILKRWLLASNKETTPEKVEAEYPEIIEDIIYQLIKERICKEQELKVEDSEIEELAKKTVRAQFAQYGMFSVPDDLLAKYTNDLLKKEESLRGFFDRALDGKFTEWVKAQVKVETKEVSLDEFEKLVV